MAGPWEKYQQGGPQPIMADPRLPSQTRKAEADAQKAAVDAQVAAAKAPAEIAAAGASAANAGADAALKRKEIERGRPNLNPGTYDAAMAGYKSALALDTIINDLEFKYLEGPGSTKGIQGLQDYFPTPTMQGFDQAASAARGTVGSALGFTGGQINSPAEIKMNIGPFVADSSNWDSNIQDKIQRLRNLQIDAFKKSVGTLGGIPDANGNITPLPEGTRLNAMTIPRIIAGAAPQAAAAGDKTTTDPVPPEMNQEYAAFLQQWRGDPRADALAAERQMLDRKYGYPEKSPQQYLDEAQKLTDAARQGASISATIPGPERQMSNTEQFRNDLVNNPVGAAGVGYLDAAGLGGVSALAGDKMNALSQSQPLPTLAGQIGGTITGTSAIGKLGRETLGRLAPSLLEGGSKAALARNIATDTAYSGGYGGVSGQGAGQSAALGALGSLGGNVVGKGIGTIVGGADISPAVQYLRNRKIPMTVGQTMGGMAKGIEDAATSLPVVGDMIGRRYRDSLTALSREGLKDAGAPIGYTPQSVGQAGLNEVGGTFTPGNGGAIGKYYDNVTAGASVPFDGQFIGDMSNFGQAANKLPKDYRRLAAKAVEAKVAPVTDTGIMTGDTYQQAMRGLKGYKSQYRGPGFEQDYRDALSIAQDALKSQMKRGGGASVAAGLDSADQAYRTFKTFEDAAMRADGAGYLPTASQLQDAIKKTGRKFPGANPLQPLADAGQQVLPSRLPDSGTGRRLIQAGIGAGALGGAGGYDYASEGDSNALAKTAAILALLTAGGTKVGQKALTEAIVNRPKALTKLGRGIAARRGLFGSAAVPLALSTGN